MDASGKVINQLSKEESKWFAIYTGYKREKYVKTILEKQEIEVFLPLKKVHRQWDRKKRVVELPLINGYLFVKIKKAEYLAVLTSQYVVRFLKIGKSLEAIPEEQIEILKRVIGANIPLQTTSDMMNTGDAVEIVAGSLIGMKGRMQEIKGKDTLVIRLDKLGFDLHLELSRNLVKPISNQHLEFI